MRKWTVVAALGVAIIGFNESSNHIFSSFILLVVAGIALYCYRDCIKKDGE
jgi:hypothetical protein